MKSPRYDGEVMEIFDLRDKLIVLDAVRGGQTPGTLYRFCPEEVEAQALPMNSRHQVGLIETLRIGELVNCKPKDTIAIGVQPQETALGIGLSPVVVAAVEKAVKLVLREIDS